MWCQECFLSLPWGGSVWTEGTFTSSFGKASHKCSYALCWGPLLNSTLEHHPTSSWVDPTRFRCRLKKQFFFCQS